MDKQNKLLNLLKEALSIANVLPDELSFTDFANLSGMVRRVERKLAKQVKLQNNSVNANVDD
jgi:hypothetical protein